MGTSSALEAETEKPERQRDRLGGARGDFVANLGKRRVELKAAVDGLRSEPNSKRHRDELRRRLHALGASARLLKFTQLADEVRTVETLLDKSASEGTVDDSVHRQVVDLLGRMTNLAWGQTADPTDKPLRESSPAAPTSPMGVLIVGGPALADALYMPSGRAEDDGHLFEIERTEDPGAVLDIAKALAPDVIVIDAESVDAQARAEELSADPLTESVPLLIIVRHGRSAEVSSLLALGVAKVLTKPVSPSELRRAVSMAVSSYVRRDVSRLPIGDVNLDQLGARLAEELRKGLCDSALEGGRSIAMPMGEGTEVLAALWGAVARIRDVLTIQSEGRVRFSLGGPEGAIPLAPWFDAAEQEGRSGRSVASRLSRADSNISLAKMKVLVADDDAAVCWFLAGVLKTAGATVFEARDGERALQIAKHVHPDLVISDILMPKMDGFALTRALRRDVLLKDVPTILLSWKEDLLQRVRELGADADGYLRKEASAGTIVQRVRELVRTRHKVRERIARPGEVRGRLDGLTPFTLLRLVCHERKNATISVRDASYLYEVEIRSRRPVRATRTAVSGQFERGASVMAALLGVGDGRFTVSLPREDSEVGPVRVELQGTFEEQILPVVASLRAAQSLISGPNLLCVSRLTLDDDIVRTGFSATPKTARSIINAVVSGGAPRDLLAQSSVSPRLLEDVLFDAASRGAIVQVFDGEGVDRLPEATLRETELLRGDAAASPIASLPVSGMPMLLPTSMDARSAIPVDLPPSSNLLQRALTGMLGSTTFQASPEPLTTEEGATLASSSGATASEALSSEAAASEATASTTPPGAETRPASSENARSFAEIIDEEIALLEAQARPKLPERDRETLASLSDELDQEAWFENPASEDESPIPSSGERAVKDADRGSEGALRAVMTRELTPTPSRIPPPPGLRPMLTLGSLHPPPVTEVPTPAPKNVRRSPAPPKAEEARAKTRTETPAPTNDLTPKFPRPSAYLAYAGPPKRDRKTLYWFAFAFAGLAFAVWARASRENATVSEATLFQEAPSEAQTAATSEPADVESSPTAQPEVASTAAPNAPPPDKKEEVLAEELPLREGEKLKKGYGLLEVVSAKSDTIIIDGKPMGSGPVLSLPMKAKGEPYEVRVKSRGGDRSRFVVVKDNKLVRIRLAPPWQL